MYHHRLISFLLFTSMFYLTSLLSVIGVWMLFWVSFPSLPVSSSTKSLVDTPADRDAGSDDPLFGPSRFSEESDLPDISDTPRTFPTLSRQPPLRHVPSPRSTWDAKVHHVGFTDSQLPAADADDEDGSFGFGRVGGRSDSGLGTSMEESTHQMPRRRRWRNGAV